jgi:hypothetical protein
MENFTTGTAGYQINCLNGNIARLNVTGDITLGAPTGMVDGYILTIENTTGTANSISIPDDSTFKTAGGMTMGLDDSITLIYDSGATCWRERSRSNN